MQEPLGRRKVLFGKKPVKISKELYRDVEKYIQGKDYKSVSDFIESYLSEHIRPKLEEKIVEERLRGLGYVE